MVVIIETIVAPVGRPRWSRRSARSRLGLTGDTGPGRGCQGLLGGAGAQPVVGLCGWLLARHPACVTLAVWSAGRHRTVHIGLGTPCPGQRPPPEPSATWPWP